MQNYIQAVSFKFYNSYTESRRKEIKMSGRFNSKWSTILFIFALYVSLFPDFLQ